MRSPFTAIKDRTLNRPALIGAAAGLIALAFAFLYLARGRFQPGRPDESRPRQASETPAPAAAEVSSALPTDARNADYTNEDLYRFLEKERRRLGIQKVLPRGQVAPEAKAPATPADNARQLAERRAAMREMSQEIKSLLDSRRPPTVSLDGKSTPSLLSGQDAAPAASASGVPIDPAK